MKYTVGGLRLNGQLRFALRLALPIVMSEYPAIASPAAIHAGAEFPDTLEVEGASLVLNGAGIRSAFFIDVYAAGLYLQQKSSDAKQIVAADEPMALELEIVTNLQAGARMGSPIERGFERSTNGNTEPFRNEIEVFINLFAEANSKGDRIKIVYLPNRGVAVSMNDGQERVIEGGLPFKQALFGIWLSPRPIQKSLKADMLGGK